MIFGTIIFIPFGIIALILFSLFHFMGKSKEVRYSSLIKALKVVMGIASFFIIIDLSFYVYVMTHIAEFL